LDHDQYALKEILEHITRGATVIDVGAFIGDHTIAYANKVGPNGKVYAFEPNRISFECLAHNMKGFKNVKCSDVALGSVSGDLVGFVNSDNVGASHLVSGGDIETATIDDIAIEGRLSFIKIDAEGFEVDILKGAKNTIKKFKPILYVEVNSGALTRHGTSEKELLDLLVSYGYDVKGIKLGDPQYDVYCY
jgi:FkbM family methyltransferase